MGVSGERVAGLGIEEDRPPVLLRGGWDGGGEDGLLQTSDGGAWFLERSPVLLSREH